MKILDYYIIIDCKVQNERIAFQIDFVMVIKKGEFLEYDEELL